MFDILAECCQAVSRHFSLRGLIHVRYGRRCLGREQIAVIRWRLIKGRFVKALPKAERPNAIRVACDLEWRIALDPPL
jgi:hypothetical protein